MFIDKAEVLRYLGYKGQAMNNQLEELIDSCIAEIKQVAKPLYTTRVFELKVLDSKVKVLGTGLTLQGGDIARHLQGCAKGVIMAATLGVSVDNHIRLLEIGQLTKALVFDACATTAIEAVCDSVEEEIRIQAQQKELAITTRYSPGYGDLPITQQGEILRVLGAFSRIGLACTENHILTPRKSVTAIIGFQQPDQVKNAPRRGCNKCNKFNSCLYRRDGISCGN